MNCHTRWSKPKARKILWRVLLLGPVFYLLACAGCASFQRRFIYFPPAFTSEKVSQLADAAKLERWTNSAGRPIGMKRQSPIQPAQGQVLVTHGNGGCAVWCAHYADVIQQAAALDVFILEYPGYADRPGKPTEKALYAAATEAFELLPADKTIYVVGESLGTGVAAYLAANHPDQVAGMALLAPYNCLVDVAKSHMPLVPVRLLLRDRFPSEDYLRHYRGPVAMLVSGWDLVVPAKFGHRLYDGYAGPKRLWEFPRGSHGTVMEQPPAIWEQIIAFLQHPSAQPE